VEFLMGDTAKKKVTLAHRLAVAAHEVTVAQFQQFRKDHKHDATYSPQADCPVNNVTWYEAVEYCNWLSGQEGIPIDQWCYEPNDQGKYDDGMKIPVDFLKRTGYRLPTDAEWEYACRANTTSSYSFGEPVELLDRYAWYVSNSKDRTWPVGLLKPNRLGQFDMHGNAWEWSHDLYESKRDNAVESIVKSQDRRMLRGGAYSNPQVYARSANRNNSQPDTRSANIGFRPARTYP
jgi:formylglycine-generating enzyme required for sulfatase activity